MHVCVCACEWSQDNLFWCDFIWVRATFHNLNTWFTALMSKPQSDQIAAPTEHAAYEWCRLHFGASTQREIVELLNTTQRERERKRDAHEDHQLWGKSDTYGTYYKFAGPCSTHLHDKVGQKHSMLQLPKQSNCRTVEQSSSCASQHMVGVLIIH